MGRALGLNSREGTGQFFEAAETLFDHTGDQWFLVKFRIRTLTESPIVGWGNHLSGNPRFNGLYVDSGGFIAAATHNGSGLNTTALKQGVPGKWETVILKTTGRNVPTVQKVWIANEANSFVITGNNTGPSASEVTGYQIGIKRSFSSPSGNTFDGDIEYVWVGGGELYDGTVRNIFNKKTWPNPWYGWDFSNKGKGFANLVPGGNALSNTNGFFFVESKGVKEEEFISVEVVAGGISIPVASYHYNHNIGHHT